MPGTDVHCLTCGAEIALQAGTAIGRPPRYCSNACRQRAYRKRRSAADSTPATETGAEPPAAKLPAAEPPAVEPPAVEPHGAEAHGAEAHAAEPHGAESHATETAAELPAAEPPAQLSVAVLPAALDSFVGRADELVALGRLLRAHRLLTIVGPAGVGKTRLALELAGKARRSFPDGVCLVELGALRHPELVPQAVATALSVAERPGVPLLDTVCVAVGRRRLLLVLDNCEHLLEVCGQLAVTLLGRCGGMRIVATSRELLRVPGEVTVAGRELSAADAVRLFTDRAAAAGRPVPTAEMPLVEAICTRLDRVPLAIELAARLVHWLPLAEIGHRLDDRFGLLTMGSRLAEDRHRDLRSAIGWSYGLLSPAEQAVFRRVALLPGGFGLDAAAAVCGGADVPEADVPEADVPEAVVPEVVSALAAKSLVVPVPCPTGRARFRQLESIALYARERLAEHGEDVVTAARVVDWLAGLAAPIAEGFTVAADLEERLDLEHDNLLDALDSLAPADERRLLLVAALVRCWIRRGQIADGLARLAETLDATDPRSRYRDLALVEASWLAGWRGDHDAALRLAQEAVALTRNGGPPAALARALAALGFAHQQRGEFGPAVASYTACLRQVRPLGSPLAVAMCLNNVATAHLLAGSPQEAMTALHEALPIYRAQAEPGRLASILQTAGAVALERDDLPAAAADFTEALEMLLAGPARAKARLLPYLLEGLGIVAIRDGRYDRGLPLVAAGRASRAGADTGVEEPWWRRLVEAGLALAGRRLPERRVQELLAEGARLPARSAAGHALDDNWTAGQRGAGQRASAPRTGGGAVLSRRERDVVALLVQGLTNRQISARLGISERTVESHLEHVRTKLDLRSRTQLAAWGATNPR